MYEEVIEAKARFLRQFGLNDTDKVIQYFNDHIANVDERNISVRINNLAKTMLNNYYNGDKTFVKVKGE